ncbi:hypothetical protein Misp01_54760 [Microtetraspora sp. NBRC 13810]|uniref:anti-sigma factor family protein n=1 Tax=Microtetraspora sp. NBRC 13810 TaxID=3030990 RepID=UPI0024A6049D|nr:zf-HC2 domain-containing protein [Microtetraspora sp. NBRC 13810]GLW10348.1 hypothetical protein Misp01_54760 [Microtetraspora sp. NBRC 13810]
MSCEEVRMSLGVHALGALDRDEAALVEAHLADCAECRAEYEELAGVSAFLAKVSEQDIAHAGSPPHAVLDRLLSAKARRRRRARLFLVAASVAGLAVLGGVVVRAGLTGSGGVDSQAAAPASASFTASPPAQDRRAGQEFGEPLVATGPSGQRSRTGPPAEAVPKDEATAAKADVDVQQKNGEVRAHLKLFARTSGSAVQIALSGVPGGTHCSLIAVAHDGSRDAAGSWRVSTAGYERFTGSTGFAPGAIDRFDVVTSNGDVLLSIKVRA